ncbi:MAG: transglutaminase-like domain-containing protein [Candidatus Hadarchaeales archaeon]
MGALVAIGAVVFLSFGPEGEPKFADFYEYHIGETRINWDGSAECRLVAWMPPSQLTSYFKTIALSIGENDIMTSYEANIRKLYAMMGLELENFSGSISGLGDNENFTVTMTWRIPYLARWDGDLWKVDLSWVDRRMGAEDYISDADRSWIQMRSLVTAIGLNFAFYHVISEDITYFPEGATDVRLREESYFMDYGGGSYQRGSVGLLTSDGRYMLVENTVEVTSTENEMTITLEEFLENYSERVVEYSGPGPENLSFLDTLEWVRLDLKYGREMEENYPICLEGWRWLSPSQIFRGSARAILSISEGSELTLEEVPDTRWPSQEVGDWSTCWAELSMEDYLRLAAQVAGLESIPAWFETPAGRMRPSDLLYTFLRILSDFRRSCRLPERVMVAPVPRGELAWGSHTLGAENAYYLLSEPYVVVKGKQALEVLENLPSGLDNRKTVEEICNWTGSNITYGLYFKPPTSEEIMRIGRGQCRDFTNVYLALARTAGVPARRVYGWITSEWTPPAGWEFVVTKTPDGRTVASHAWAQALIPGEGWVSLEPQSKRPALYIGNLPYDVYRQTEQTWVEVLAGYEMVRETM